MSKTFKYNPFSDELDIVQDTAVSDARYLKIDQTSPQTTTGTFTFPQVGINTSGVPSNIRNSSSYGLNIVYLQPDINNYPDSALGVQKFVSLASGVALSAVNADNSANTPLEFRASKYYFWSGNVGIGLDNPTVALEVAGTAVPITTTEYPVNYYFNLTYPNVSGGSAYGQYTDSYVGTQDFYDGGDNYLYSSYDSHIIASIDYTTGLIDGSPYLSENIDAITYTYTPLVITAIKSDDSLEIGRIGIGMSPPTTAIDVLAKRGDSNAGQLRIFGDADHAYLQFGSTEASSYECGFQLIGIGSTAYPNWTIKCAANSSALDFFADAFNGYMRLTTAGKLKVGAATNPSYTLDVAGDIYTANIVRAPQVKTDTSSATDLTVTTGSQKTLLLGTVVYKDIFFPMGTPKATGAGNPTKVNWIGNLDGYSFAINDVHSFDPQEYSHDGKVGANIVWHVHWVSRTNVAAARYVKWELEWTWALPSGVFVTPVTQSAEATVPTSTTANTHYLTDIYTYTPTNVTPGSMFHVRIKRIAASGTDPADDPVVLGVHFHYQIDTIGSRQITTK